MDVRGRRGEGDDAGGGSTTDYNAILEEIVQHIALRAGISLANVTGKLVNVSAEALAAAEANQQRKLPRGGVVLGNPGSRCCAWRRRWTVMRPPPPTRRRGRLATPKRAFAAVVDGIAKLTTAGIPWTTSSRWCRGCRSSRCRASRPRPATPS